jgi:ATP-binding cassette subfamily B protein
VACYFFGWVSSMVQEAGVSKRLNEFLKIEPEIKKIKNKNIIEGSISFENVRYTYEDTNIKALQNISFTVKKKTLAILGKQVLENQRFYL